MRARRHLPPTDRATPCGARKSRKLRGSNVCAAGEYPGFGAVHDQAPGGLDDDRGGGAVGVGPLDGLARAAGSPSASATRTKWTEGRLSSPGPSGRRATNSGVTTVSRRTSSVSASPSILPAANRHAQLRSAFDLLAAELERPGPGAATIVPALLDLLLLAGSATKLSTVDNNNVDVQYTGAALTLYGGDAGYLLLHRVEHGLSGEPRGPEKPATTTEGVEVGRRAGQAVACRWARPKGPGTTPCVSARPTTAGASTRRYGMWLRGPRTTTATRPRPGRMRTDLPQDTPEA
jgi:Cupin